MYTVRQYVVTIYIRYGRRRRLKNIDDKNRQPAAGLKRNEDILMANRKKYNNAACPRKNTIPRAGPILSKPFGGYRAEFKLNAKAHVDENEVASSEFT